jgi:hypothetical protein
MDRLLGIGNEREHVLKLRVLVVEWDLLVEFRVSLEVNVDSG